MRLSPVLLLALLVAAGCASNRTLSVPIRGVSPLNPNEAKESTPVNVRLFPLKAADRFRAATVDQIWTDAKGALGPDLLGEPMVVTVFPGTVGDPPVVQRFEVAGGTAFVGVLAMYQRSDAQDRRAIAVPVDEVKDHGLVLTGFTVAVDRPEPAPAR